MSEINEKPYVAEWEAKIPEFKSLFEGATIGWRTVPIYGKYRFALGDMDQNKQARLYDLMLEMIETVDYGPGADPYAEFDHMENVLSSAILETLDVEKPDGPFVWEGLSTEFRMGMIRLISKLKGGVQPTSKSELTNDPNKVAEWFDEFNKA